MKVQHLSDKEQQNKQLISLKLFHVVTQTKMKNLNTTWEALTTINYQEKKKISLKKHTFRQEMKAKQKKVKLPLDHLSLLLVDFVPPFREITNFSPNHLPPDKQNIWRHQSINLQRSLEAKKKKWIRAV